MDGSVNRTQIPNAGAFRTGNEESVTKKQSLLNTHKENFNVLNDLFNQKKINFFDNSKLPGLTPEQESLMGTRPDLNIKAYGYGMSGITDDSAKFISAFVRNIHPMKSPEALHALEQYRDSLRGEVGKLGRSQTKAIYIEINEKIFDITFGQAMKYALSFKGVESKFPRGTTYNDIYAYAMHHGLKMQKEWWFNTAPFATGKEPPVGSYGIGQISYDYEKHCFGFKFEPLANSGKVHIGYCEVPMNGLSVESTKPAEEHKSTFQKHENFSINS